jgi:hypothetical protein
MKKILLLTILITSLFSARLHFDTYKLGNGMGETLLVLGGIHGNEPGGYFAPAILVKFYKINKGNIWIAPNLNFDSIIRNSRGIYGDMNRKFDVIKTSDKDFEIIRDIKLLVLNKNVDLILNLHDGHGFYRRTWQNSIFNPRAWGQTFIIDQKEVNTENQKFKDLDAIAQKVSKKLNDGELIEDYHTFRVKNTKTKEKDEQMKLSLTYFAITHNKPAFAIETSKNIPNLTYKVQYQLKAIEEFMNVMGIEYERDFNLDNFDELNKIVYNFMNVKINNNILLPMSDLRKNLYYFPLNSHNKFEFEHPLGTYSEKSNRVNLHIGNIEVSKLKPQNFKLDNSLKKVKMVVDNKEIETDLPSIVDIKDSFEVLLSDEYRVNIIGFSKSGLKNESNVKIHKKDIMKRYSLDKSGKLFRIEIYKDGKFCGMITARF